MITQWIENDGARILELNFWLRIGDLGCERHLGQHRQKRNFK